MEDLTMADEPLRVRSNSGAFAFACAAGLVIASSMIAVSPSAQDAKDVLRGPSVSEQTAKTLVAHDMMGRLVLIEGRPEEAAFELLAVEEERRELARAAVQQRSVELGLALVEHIDLLKQSADAQKSGDENAARDLAQQLYDTLDPTHARDPMLEVFESLLTGDELVEMRRLLDEYWNAWIDRELVNAQVRDEATRERVQRRLAQRLFQQELQRTYRWSIRPYRERLDLIYSAVEPTDEQRQAIRTIIIDFIRETRLEPTVEQRLDALKKIYLLLDDDRRTRLFELVAASQFNR
jgi:hypothetical protein